MPDTPSAPVVSVVIVSRRGGPELLECVESFSRAADGGTELVVAASGDRSDAGRLRAGFPAVRLLHVPASPPLPDLRAAGLLAARGDIIALTSDRCRPAGGWLAALRRSHAASDAAAIGGALQPEEGGTRAERAVVYCEYGRFVPPFAPAETSDLPAQNVSYKRCALEALADLLAPAVWEPLWYRRLRLRGLHLRRDPSIVVAIRTRGPFGRFLRERYDYARSFSGQRVDGRSWLYRAAYAAGAPLLPALVLGRVFRNVVPKRRHRLAALGCLPWIALLAIASAAGECAGSLAGPGTSASRID